MPSSVPVARRLQRLRVPVSAVMRGALLLVTIALAVVQGDGGVAGWLVALSTIAAGLAIVRPSGRVHVGTVLVETLVVAAAIIATGGSDSALLPYLLAPAFDAGSEAGVVGAVVVPALAAVCLAVGRAVVAVGDGAGQYTVAVFEWVLLAAAVGLLAAWTRRLLLAPSTVPESDDAYVSAYRLLSQLRTVTRTLSGGLDAVALAQSLLNDLRALLAFDRAVIYVRAGGERLVPLLHEPDGTLPWQVRVDDDSAFAEAWLSQQPQWRPRPFPGGRVSDASSLVLPLRIGLRTFGLVALERGGHEPLAPGELREAQRRADDVALRLETALLFNEVREIATVEERRRVAREIHDGIAQELASWGYLLDALVAETRDSDVEEPLRKLRGELTRIISEIRLSIFDLRSGVDQYGGLGAALSEYVRSVGTSSGLTVHLTLTEDPARLPPDVEAELLRIAQEAITNARKHASAANLWVQCEISPPRAFLRVEDDGVGLGPGREDSFGLEIMRERASRLRGRLTIAPREGATGTVVELVVGANRLSR